VFSSSAGDVVVEDFDDLSSEINVDAVGEVGGIMVAVVTDMSRCVGGDKGGVLLLFMIGISEGRAAGSTGLSNSRVNDGEVGEVGTLEGRLFMP
jgi:hypothetical protein